MKDNHVENIKTAILEGDSIEAQGWMIRINAADEIEVWPPKGEGFTTTLTHLDRAVADFCRKADIPTPGVNEQQPDAVKLPDKLITKDNSDIPTPKPKTQVKPSAQPGTSFGDADIPAGTENRVLPDPELNTRPMPRDFGMGDPDLGPDSSGKDLKVGRRGALRKIAVEIPIEDVDFEVYAEPEDEPIEGNASAIDEETDREVVEEIKEQLESGNEWAWCTAVVVATWTDPENGETYEGKDYLGGCSYKNEKDFMQSGGYYEDMKQQAYENLKQEVVSQSQMPSLKRSNHFTDTFDKEPDAAEYYRKLQARSPSAELLAGIMDAEGWAATHVFAGEGLDSVPKINTQQPDALKVDVGDDVAGTYDRKKELDERLRPELDKGDKQARRNAGPKLREKWDVNGGYGRDIEAESAEELHNLTRALGGEEVDWSKLMPKKPEEQAAEVRAQDEGVAPAEPVVARTNRRGQHYQDMLDEDPNYDFESDSEYWVENWLNGNKRDTVTRLKDHPELVDKVYEMLPDEDKKSFFRMFREARKRAVDEKAKDYWSKYMKDYGEELTKGDITKDKARDKRDTEKKAQAAPPDPMQPAAPAPATPAPKAPTPGGQLPATPGAPAPKAPAGPKGLAPGTGDSGLTALGWTPEDLAVMADDEKQGILKIQLHKPGTRPKPAPAAPKAPAQPGQPAPAAPGGVQAPKPAQPGMPTTPAPSPVPQATARRRQVGLRRSQAMPPVEEAPMQAPAPQAEDPAQVGGPAVSPSKKPGGEGAPDEERAFQILSEIQAQQVNATTPSQVKSQKASILSQRLLTEIGLSMRDARELFGTKDLTSLFQ